MSLLRRSLTPSMLVALLALIVALSGSAYAAARLKPNSVGTVQLKAGAVTGAKVRNGSLRLQDFAARDRARLKGARGATGATGATGQAGPAGPTGSSGIAKVSAITTDELSTAGQLTPNTVSPIADLASVGVEQDDATVRVTYVAQAVGSNSSCVYQLRLDDTDTRGNVGPGPFTLATAGAAVAVGAASGPLTLDATFVGVDQGNVSIRVYAVSSVAGTTCNVGSTTVPGSLTAEEYDLS